MAGIGDACDNSCTTQKFAVPAVSLLILFLGYSPQYLFYTADDLAPGQLTTSQSRLFNAILFCIWWTYYKACTVDPGRYVFTSRVLELTSSDDDDEHHDYGASTGREVETGEKGKRAEDVKRNKTKNNANKDKLKYARWCRKCSAPKPPRAHHCRTCARCVPKMDHHCPWTTNCVSMATFPHFFRFLFFTNLGLWYLSRLLFSRFAALWRDRFLPAYLGPSLLSLIHLALLAGVNFFTSLALGIMLATTIRGWLFNTTSIEGWETERHEELLRRRARRGEEFWRDDSDGESDDSDGSDDSARGPRERVEFPYDLGFFDNLSQAMGTRNVLAWFWPFAGHPGVAPTEGEGTGWQWPENGFNRREGMWPPPDPERRHNQWPAGRKAPVVDDEGMAAMPRYENPEDQIAAFKRRQEADLRRRQGQRTRLIAELEEVDAEFVEGPDGGSGDSYASEEDGTAGAGVGVGGRGVVVGASSSSGARSRARWTNSDGETLGDYGVDEETEVDDRKRSTGPVAGETLVGGVADEDVPLAELVRRRKVLRKDDEG